MRHVSLVVEVPFLIFGFGSGIGIGRFPQLFFILGVGSIGLCRRFFSFFFWGVGSICPEGRS
jgi:hypothetical protein